MEDFILKYASDYKSYIGFLTIISDEKNITELVFGNLEHYFSTKNSQKKQLLPKLLGENTGKEILHLHKEAFLQLDQYFKGERRDFDLPLKIEGTIFQQQVWKALMTIPYGEVRSYKQIAEQVGNPKACRAVGMANNRNPLPLFIPCHRVIGANGSLVGYGGGLDIKIKLLQLEKSNDPK